MTKPWTTTQFCLWLPILLAVICCATEHTHYRVNPMAAGGAELSGIDLKEEVRPAIIQQIKNDLNHHGLLLFRGQGVISGDRQVEITQWFGQIYSFPKSHVKAPRGDLIRISNDKEEGFDKLQTPSYMIDGAHLEKPFAYGVWHVVAAPNVSDTSFLDLYRAVKRLDPDRAAEWERLWIETHPGPPPKQATVYPFIYKHPVTRRKTILLASPMLSSFHYDYDSVEKKRRPRPGESRELATDIIELFRNMSDVAYNHTWQEGDLIVVDNLAVATWVKPESQKSPAEVGLRVLHKCMVNGMHAPSKGYHVPRDKPIKREEASAARGEPDFRQMRQEQFKAAHAEALEKGRVKSNSKSSKPRADAKTETKSNAGPRDEL